MGALQDGRNDIEMWGYDTDGYVFEHREVVWAGSRQLQVRVTDRSGASIQNAWARVRLLEARDVEQSGFTDYWGQATAINLPSSSALLVVVEADGYVPVETVVTAYATSVTVELDLDNNDFSRGGVGGWTTGNTGAYVFQHSEASLPLVPCPECKIRTVGGGEGAGGTVTEIALAGGFLPSGAGGSGDLDLCVSTEDRAAPQTVTRFFRARPGAKQATIRYRFQTAEGWQGRVAFNDWYRIRLTTASGGVAETTGTVSTVRFLFDQNQTTPWAQLSVPVRDQDLVLVEVTVANAVDDTSRSYVYVDRVEEAVYAVTKFELNEMHHDTDPNRSARPIRPLEFFSLSSHPAYNGTTRVHGQLAFRAPAAASLIEVKLRLVAGGRIIATGVLSTEARAALLNRAFGSQQKLEFRVPMAGQPAESGWLFEIPLWQLAAVDQTSEAQITPVLDVTWSDGQTVSLAWPFKERFRKLVNYSGTNRVPGRDWGDCEGLSPTDIPSRRPPYPCGGDGWARPSFAAAATRATAGGVRFGDFSKMNGGRFPPHMEHRFGMDVDGDVPGYSAGRDRAVALRMVEFLNQMVTGGQGSVKDVLVTFADDRDVPENRDQFWLAIKDVTLADGRRARDVIRKAAGHADHFHVRWK